MESEGDEGEGKSERRHTTKKYGCGRQRRRTVSRHFGVPEERQERGSGTEGNLEESFGCCSNEQHRLQQVSIDPRESEGKAATASEAPAQSAIPCADDSSSEELEMQLQKAACHK